MSTNRRWRREFFAAENSDLMSQILAIELSNLYTVLAGYILVEYAAFPARKSNVATYRERQWIEDKPWVSMMCLLETQPFVKLHASSRELHTVTLLRVTHILGVFFSYWNSVLS